MSRKTKNRKEESNGNLSKSSKVPCVKSRRKEVNAVLESFVKKESKPLMSVNDEKRWLREQKRAAKRERQRRNDVATSAEIHLEKATDSLQTVTVSGSNDIVMTDTSN